MASPTPSTPPRTSAFTPLNALTPTSAMGDLRLGMNHNVQHEESALRTTLAAEAAATASSVASPDTIATAVNTPITPDEDYEDVDTAKPVDFIDEPVLTPAAANLLQSLRSLDDVIANKATARPKVFPHNFDFQTCTSRDLLKAYLDPLNPQATLHAEDLERFEGKDEIEKATNMLQQLQSAALDGYDKAPCFDHAEAKGSNFTTKDNAGWTKDWDALLATYEPPIVKAAVALGYRVAKREQLAKDGRLEEFAICTREKYSVPGCLTHQYRNDAFRSAISNYFGRNRSGPTIPGLLPSWCRKHYQKEAYTDEQWQNHKKILILKVIDRHEMLANKEGKSGLTFEILLREWDEKRVVEVATGKGDGAPKAKDKHPTPLAVLQHIHRKYVGKNQSAATVKELTQYVHDEYLKMLDDWKAERSESDIKRLQKGEGPKLPEFQLIAEWKSLYTPTEMARIMPTTPRKANKNKGPVSNTPKRPQPVVDDEDKVKPKSKGKGRGKGTTKSSSKTRTPKRSRKEAEETTDEEVKDEVEGETELEDESPTKKRRTK